MSRPPNRHARDVSEPVGGEFAVTATLPTLQDVISFKEGTVEPATGYYRFVLHPRLRELARLLTERFHCRHCRFAESPQVALRELLLCTASASPGPRRAFFCGEEGSWAAGSGFLDALRAAGVAAERLDPGESLPELGASDSLVVFTEDAARIAAPRASLVAHARAARASIVVVLPAPPAAVPEEFPARFWVTGLSIAGGTPVDGGAVLSSADRPMGRLAEWMKRRGAFLSARNAAAWLTGNAPARRSAAPAAAASAICGREYGTQAFLYASGMAALTAVLDVLRRPGRSQIVSIGHLYSDTFDSLRFAPRAQGERENVFLGVDEMDKLESAITDQTAAILTESITNPLSDVPDLPAVSAAARRRGVPLVVDNTIATPFNCRPLDLGADVVVHSTTKFLNGKNNHAGGALVVRDTGFGRLLEARQETLGNRMSALEAEELEKNLATFDERMERFNANGAAVAEFLASHPAVGKLYFNGHPSHRCYATARRLLRGAGSVIGMTLANDSREGLRAFYDSPLPGLIKAPSLGSDVTLICPYILLAHYNEPEEVLESIGASRWLVRISVGCEPDIGPVITSLGRALAAVPAAG